MEKSSKFDYNLVTVGMLYLLAFVFYQGTFSVLDAGSRVFPRVISIAAALFASMLLVRSLFQKEKETFHFDGGMKVVSLTLMTVAYIFVMGYVGFYLATPVFLVGCFLYLDVRNKKVLLLIPLIMDVVVAVFFDFLFRIPIPMGSLVEPVLRSLNLI